MQTNPAVEQNKTLNGPLVREISPVEKEKVYGGNDLVKSQVLSSEWKTERVREDASGDREDGKKDDDDMPCVIGDSEGDCVWRGSRRSVGSSFHRQGAAYWKKGGMKGWRHSKVPFEMPYFTVFQGIVPVWHKAVQSPYVVI